MTQPLLALLGVWILLLAIGFAAWPLFAATRREVDRREIELGELEAEKARLIEDLHELELDRETGKLSDEDYRANRTRLKTRAVDVMRRIEELRGDVAVVEDDAGTAPTSADGAGERSARKEMAESSR